GPSVTPFEFADDPMARGLADSNGNALIGSYANGAVLIIPGFEADVSPRTLGNGSVTVADWSQVGNFVAGFAVPADGSEFQRADCAPESTLGDGRLSIADWVMAGRYAAGLAAPIAAGGPAEPPPSPPCGGKALGQAYLPRRGPGGQRART